MPKELKKSVTNYSEKEDEKHRNIRRDLFGRISKCGEQEKFEFFLTNRKNNAIFENIDVVLSKTQ